VDKSVAVVGAGVGGLAAAVGLRHAGWEVTVLERWPRVVGTGTALGLWPEAQAALERLGLGEALRAVATPYRAGTIRSSHGRRLTQLPLARIERSAGRPVVLVPRPALIELLLAALEDTPVHTSVAISEPHALRGAHDVVVGADGLRSTVRQAHFSGRSRARDAGFTAWRGVVEADTFEHGEIWGRGLLFGVTAMAPGRTNWYAAVAGHAPRVEPEEALVTLRTAYAGWPAPVAELLANTAPSSLLRHQVYDLAPALPSYVMGNVALVGDAAHAMTPTLGQGACQALIDGVALADCLQHAADPADVEPALRRYDQRRRRPTQKLAAASRLAAKVTLARHLAPARDVLTLLSSPLSR
jgi:2-polyprenyl-6-methoxyphenol hydroxylase-like FAD-dependent oxidoreductase